MKMSVKNKNKKNTLPPIVDTQKWNKVWKTWLKKNMHDNYSMSGFWFVNENGEMSAYYDTLSRCNYILNNEKTIVFPGMCQDNTPESDVFGVNWDEMVICNDILHKKALAQATSILENYMSTQDGSIYLTPDASIVSGLKNIPVKHTNGGNSDSGASDAGEETLFDFLHTVEPLRWKIADENGDYEPWFLKSLLPLSVVQWPQRSKFLLKNFPFDYTCVESSDLPFIVKTSIVTKLLLENTVNTVNEYPFKNIYVAMDGESYKHVFQNDKLKNKLWNIAKFIDQFKDVISSYNTITLVKDNVKIANPTHKSKRNKYDPEFIFSLQEKYEDPPPNLPTVKIDEMHKVNKGRWQIHRRKAMSHNAGNTDEEKIRQIRGYMNKLTDKTMDTIIPKMIPLINERIVSDVVQLLYEKISLDKYFHPIYAKVCTDFKERNDTFLDAFVSKCTDHVPLYKEDDDEDTDLRKKREISVMMFFAYLLNENVIDYQSVEYWINNWLNNTSNLTMREIELLCSFYRHWDCPCYAVDEFLDFIKNYSQDKSNPARFRFMCMDVIDIITKSKSETIVKLKSVIIPLEEMLLDDSISTDNLDDVPVYVRKLNRWLITSMARTKAEMSKTENLHQTFILMKKFIFNTFSDIFLESVKPFLFQNIYQRWKPYMYEEIKTYFLMSLSFVYSFYPGIVEEIYCRFDMFQNSDKTTFLDNGFESLWTADRLKNTLDDKEFEMFESIIEMITVLKKVRKTLDIPKYKPWSVLIACETDSIYDYCLVLYDLIQNQTNSKELSVELTRDNRKINDRYRVVQENTNQDVTLYYDYRKSHHRNNGGTKYRRNRKKNNGGGEHRFNKRSSSNHRRSSNRNRKNKN
jgi:hypothetical protein